MSALLALDTSTDVCSVACSLSDHLKEHTRLLPRAHNRHVLVMLEEVLEGRSLSDFDAIVCGVGPGSFTGIRVAVGVAQGLAWSLSLPVIPFCSLMSQALSGVAGRQEQFKHVLSVTQAQGDLVYARLFRCDDAGLHPEGDPLLGQPAALVARLSQQVQGSLAILGDAAEAFIDHTVVRPVYVCSETRPNGAAMLDWVRDHAAAFPKMAPELLTPCYVQTDIGWKKISEQPRRA